eukprot:1158929-Pelagomonas_calceolata.AAC.3
MAANQVGQRPQMVHIRVREHNSVHMEELAAHTGVHACVVCSYMSACICLLVDGDGEESMTEYAPDNKLTM